MPVPAGTSWPPVLVQHGLADSHMPVPAGTSWQPVLVPNAIG